MSDKFKAVGLPENIEIDIPDKNSRRKQFLLRRDFSCVS